MKRRAILRSLAGRRRRPGAGLADRGRRRRPPPVAARRAASGWSSAASAGRPTTRCWRSSSVTASSTSAARPPGGEDAEGPWTPDALPRLKERCDKAGVALDMIQFPFMSSSHVDRAKRRAIMLGQEPEREQRARRGGRRSSANAPRIGIPAIKYNLSVLGVLRTPAGTGRGGTRLSTWHLDEVKDPQALTRAGAMPADVAWERITHFLTRIVPIADRAQDPPRLPSARSRRAGRRACTASRACSAPSRA